MAKAWSDEEFKAKLLTDPMTAFKENNVIVPEGVAVRMVENTDNLMRFILPQEPSGELLDLQLSNVGGAGGDVSIWADVARIEGWV